MSEPAQVAVQGVTFTCTSVGGSRGGYGWTPPRWVCDTCARSGYGTDKHPHGANPDPDRWGNRTGWARTCLNGHAPCPWCARILTLRNDGTPRVHSRCNERPDDAELLRLVTAEARGIARLGVRGPLNRDALALLDRMTANLATQEPTA